MYKKLIWIFFSFKSIKNLLNQKIQFFRMHADGGAAAT